MRTFKILGLLLDYPTQALMAHLEDCEQELRQEKFLPRKHLQAVTKFLEALKDQDLYQLQEEYVSTFDRGRSHSLHLFEHIYGESRDRGQAMVNLSEAYEEKGFFIKQSELPDYLPMFLEFLSLCPSHQAIDMLGEPIDILAMIAARLHKKDSSYAVIFDAVVALSKVKPDKAKISEILETEVEDTSLEAIDKEWEEAAAFGGDPTQSDCGTCASKSNTQYVSIN